MRFLIAKEKIMRNYLLDTNMFSYIAKGSSPSAIKEFRRLSANKSEVQLCVSVITEAELHYGKEKHHALRSWPAISDLLAYVQILPWTSQEALVYGKLRAKLESQGVTVAAMDLLIAAQAIAASAVLITHDKIFQHIEDLESVWDWATDL
jgi:tRNA(fMet)-specific endonuclease VapC